MSTNKLNSLKKRHFQLFKDWQLQTSHTFSMGCPLGGVGSHEHGSFVRLRVISVRNSAVSHLQLVLPGAGGRHICPEEGTWMKTTLSPTVHTLSCSAPFTSYRDPVLSGNSSSKIPFGSSRGNLMGGGVWMKYCPYWCSWAQGYSNIFSPPATHARFLSLGLAFLLI
jgi:hypothetical protein